MARQKKKKGRRAYLNDFYKDASGQYVYGGNLYRYCGEGKTRRRLLSELWLLCGGGALAVLIGGCLPAPGMSGCFYVLLPYAGCLVTAVSALWALGQLTGGGDPLREYTYEVTVLKLPFRLLLAAIFAGVTFLGEILLFFLEGADRQGAAMAGLLILLLVAGGCFYAGRWVLKQSRWEKKEK